MQKRGRRLEPLKHGSTHHTLMRREHQDELMLRGRGERT